MLKAGLLFLSVIVCLNGWAQELNPHFKKGEERKYQIEQITKTPAEKPYQIFNLTKKDVKIKVVNVDSSLISLEWTYLNVAFTDSVPQFNPIMELMSTLSQGLTVKYTLNEKGIIQSVSNYKEISNRIKLRTDSLTHLMSNDASVDPSTVKRLQFQFQVMFSTEQQIRNLIVSDVFKFHELYGLSFKNGSQQISAIDPPSDKYEIQLSATGTDSYNFEGTLIESFDSKKQGRKKYEFDAINGWLKKYTHETSTGDPISVLLLYTIKAD